MNARESQSVAALSVLTSLLSSSVLSREVNKKLLVLQMSSAPTVLEPRGETTSSRLSTLTRKRMMSASTLLLVKSREVQRLSTSHQTSNVSSPRPVSAASTCTRRKLLHVTLTLVKTFKSTKSSSLSTLRRRRHRRKPPRRQLLHDFNSVLPSL